jgi:4-hydroxy-L-threonine phosphate dehydrogenase PdxA
MAITVLVEVPDEDTLQKIFEAAIAAHIDDISKTLDRFGIGDWGVTVVARGPERGQIGVFSTEEDEDFFQGLTRFSDNQRTPKEFMRK